MDVLVGVGVEARVEARVEAGAEAGVEAREARSGMASRRRDWQNQSEQQLWFKLCMIDLIADVIFRSDSEEEGSQEEPLDVEEPEKDEPVDMGSSDSEEDEQQTDRPYNELLELLQANSGSKGPARKKRKIERDDKLADEEPVPEIDGEESASEADAGDLLEVQEPSDDEDGSIVGADESDDEDGNLRLAAFCLGIS